MGNVRVLVLVPESGLRGQIIDRLRGDLGQIPWAFTPVDTADRLISEMRLRSADLIIAASEFPGGTLRELCERLLSLTGDTPIIGLIARGDSPVRGTTPIEVPVLNWKQTLAQIASSLSEEVKGRYGLIQLDTLVRRRLKEWGKRYSRNPGTTNSVAIFQVPTSIHLGEGSIYHDSPTKEFSSQIRLLKRQTPIWAEIFVLAMTGSGALLARYLWEDEAVFSVARVFAVAFVVNVIAFGALRIVERISLKTT